MIRTENERKEAESRIKAEEGRITDLRARLIEQGLDEASIKRVVDPLLSFQVQLKEEVEAFQKMQEGDFGVIKNLRDFGRILIGLRIYAGLSQRKLAALLEVDESQVSRDERNEYRNITIERASKMFELLHAAVTLEVKPPEDREALKRELATV